MKTPHVYAHNHDILVSQGFVCTPYEACWQDVGDAENGPELDGHPGFTEYESDTLRIMYDSEGNQCRAEMRNYEMEEFFEQAYQAQQTHCQL